MSLAPFVQYSDKTLPVESSLTAETAGKTYLKLKEFLARPFGHQVPVRWMPKLKYGWTRLRYEDFCLWYGLYPFTREMQERFIQNGGKRNRKTIGFD